MIFVNNQIEKEKVYQSHEEMYPKLYYMDFSGKVKQIKHIDVEISNEDIFIQSDITDCNLLKKETEKILYELLESAQKRMIESQKIITAIAKVLEV